MLNGCQHSSILGVDFDEVKDSIVSCLHQHLRWLVLVSILVPVEFQETVLQVEHDSRYDLFLCLQSGPISGRSCGERLRLVIPLAWSMRSVSLLIPIWTEDFACWHLCFVKARVRAALRVRQIDVQVAHIVCWVSVFSQIGARWRGHIRHTRLTLFHSSWLVFHTVLTILVFKNLWSYPCIGWSCNAHWFVSFWHRRTFVKGLRNGWM